MDHENSKTLASFDLTTVCHRQRLGRGCRYCYVETSRREGFRAKKEREYRPYRSWVLSLRQATIDQLNALGGIRMFSFSDYEAAHRRDVNRFLGDCLLRGLRAKAVTKSIAFVMRHHDDPALSVVHLSVDRLREGGGPIRHPQARRIRARYRKVLVRAVCLSPEDLEWFGARPWVDILTLNHGRNGFHQFTRLEREAARAQYGDRLCCATGVCRTCPVRCQVDQVARAG